MCRRVTCLSHVCCWQLSSVMSHFVRISPKQMKIMIVQHKNNCVKDDHHCSTAFAFIFGASLINWRRRMLFDFVSSSRRKRMTFFKVQTSQFMYFELKKAFSFELCCLEHERCLYSLQVWAWGEFKVLNLLLSNDFWDRAKKDSNGVSLQFKEKGKLLPHFP